MMIIKDLTIKTIQDTCKANTDCCNCPFYAENFGEKVYFDTPKCIFDCDLPHSWPIEIPDNKNDN